MKTIYKSCYFITVTAFSILGLRILLWNCSDKFSGQPIHVNVTYTGNSKWSFDRF
jgi:hypothetical protein